MKKYNINLKCFRLRLGQRNFYLLYTIISKGIIYFIVLIIQLFSSIYNYRNVLSKRCNFIIGSHDKDLQNVQSNQTLTMGLQ